MRRLERLQTWLRHEGIDALAIPSADEFLSEFSPPSERRLEWLSGFTGSTGLAIVTQRAAALFLDGRYYHQGFAETRGSVFEVFTIAVEQRRDWLRDNVEAGGEILLDGRLHSALDIRQWHEICAAVGIQLKLTDRHPIDALWRSGRPRRFDPDIHDYPVIFAGTSREAKLALLAEHLRNSGLSGFLVADPEDVSWLLNVRASADAISVGVGEWHIVPAARSRLLAFPNETACWFVDEDRLEPHFRRALPATISLEPPSNLEGRLAQCLSVGRVSANLRTTPANFAGTDPFRSGLTDDPFVARKRWVKSDAEISGARAAHIQDAAAVIKLMAELATGECATMDEFEVATRIEGYRRQSPYYLGPSMPAMSAAGLSGAQAHYVPTKGNSRKLADHPIYWLDSGGQYLGGTTDNTFTVALKVPEPRHVEVHTLVTRGFLALTMTSFPRGMTGFHLYATARLPLWSRGLDFGHGTGHGVGNFLNIHEGPTISRDPSPLSAVPIERGVIISNEPGFYAPGDFGMRIESHMLVVPAAHENFLAFATISRLPIDPALIDFEELAPADRQWLADYHETVVREVGPLLDEASVQWLQGVTDSYLSHAPAMSLNARF